MGELCPAAAAAVLAPEVLRTLGEAVHELQAVLSQGLEGLPQVGLHEDAGHAELDGRAGLHALEDGVAHH